MEIILAKTAGFCFGVQRALDAVEKEIGKEERIFTYGPIIHNAEVVDDLRTRGVEILREGSLRQAQGPGEERKEPGEEAEEPAEERPLSLSKRPRDTVVIRSHGVPETTIKELQEKGYRVVDATCPYVKRIHKIAAKASENGETVVVVGAKDHPEVIGIVGWAKGRAIVVETPEEANRVSFSDGEEVTGVVQTTYNHKKFKEAVEIFSQKGYNINVANTICSATTERQTEAAELARDCDAILVIGDPGSSNTRKLFEICKALCSRTYAVATSRDLTPDMLKGVERLGITAGASAPKNIIEEVQTYVRTRSDV